MHQNEWGCDQTKLGFKMSNVKALIWFDDDQALMPRWYTFWHLFWIKSLTVIFKRTTLFWHLQCRCACGILWKLYYLVQWRHCYNTLWFLVELYFIFLRLSSIASDSVNEATWAKRFFVVLLLPRWKGKEIHSTINLLFIVSREEKTEQK